jgi:hypothetical protein
LPQGGLGFSHHGHPNPYYDDQIFEMNFGGKKNNKNNH